MYSHGFCFWPLGDGVGPLYDFCGVTLGLFGCRGCVGVVGLAVSLFFIADRGIDECIAGSEPPRFNCADDVTKASGWLDGGSSCSSIDWPANMDGVGADSSVESFRGTFLVVTVLK